AWMIDLRVLEPGCFVERHHPPAIGRAIEDVHVAMRSVEEPEQAGTRVTEGRPAAFADDSQVAVRQARHSGFRPRKQTAGGTPIARDLKRVGADQSLVPHELLGAWLVDRKTGDRWKIAGRLRRVAGSHLHRTPARPFS